MILRDYQQDCLNRILWEKNAALNGNSLCVMPTGSGKSVVIAHLAKTLNEPILILQPSREILSQNLDKLLRYVERKDVGVYSASMNEKTLGYYTFATIQSIYKKPEFFRPFRLVIVDESHLVNPKNLTGMFTRFLGGINNPKIVGFTATPYRMDTNYIHTDEKDENGYPILRATAVTKIITRMKGFFWKRILFNIGVQELIDQGFLCPLAYDDMSLIDHADIPVNKSESDFDLEKYEKIISSQRPKIHQAIAYAEKKSKSVLVFCSSVKQAVDLSGETKFSAVVSAKTPSKERERIVEDFKNGKIKTVFNMGVFTLGFDHPGLDCVVLARPTRSIGLYYQMLGRGLRTAEGKAFCRIIDLTSTVKSLGRVETIKLTKIPHSVSGRPVWDIESETGYWHGRPLYHYDITRKQHQLDKLKVK